MRKPQRFRWIPVFALSALPLVGCSGHTPTEHTAETYQSFEEFMTTVYREPWSGVFIVNGDTPIRSVEALREFYEQHVKNGALIVHRPNGVDAKWDDVQKLHLTYCVGTSFGPLHDTVVAAMHAATAEWESAANIKFIYLGDQDASCDASNDNVLFDVNLVSGQPYLARAFFPDFPRADRNIYVDSASFGFIDPYTVTGILRHELGHALGFRHEHTRPESGTCFEDSEWRALTAYDADSVMHYPFCNGTNTGDLRITPQDRYGVAVLYGNCITVQRGASGDVEDAYIADNRPDKNYGGQPIGVAGAVNGGVRQGLLRFDLSAIPAGSTVSSATMSLVRQGALSAPLNAHQVLASWSEADVTWNSLGGAYSPSIAAQVPAQQGGPTLITFDLTALAGSWLSAGNNGLLLEQASGLTQYRSSEHPQVNERPKLDICYYPPAILGCAHPRCTPGAPLDPTCDPCVAQICAADPHCCTSAWDSSCLLAVSSVCGAGACPVCGDGILSAGEQCDPPDGVTCDASCHIIYPPETDCNNLFDEDFDGLWDCQDPTSCKGTPACEPGSTPVGGACAQATDCQANDGDPFCITEALFGWSGGYCSEHCDLTTNDCTGNGTCVDIGFGNGYGICFQTCATNSDCRPGYGCQLSVGQQMACIPAQEVCSGGADEDNDGLIDCQDPDCFYAQECAVCGDGVVTGDETCDPPDGVTCDASCHVIVGPESDCGNLWDDDQDGLYDCQDPTSCQGTPACTPGSTPVGGACAAPTDCQASGEDPFCITEAQFGWTGGYCSEYCDLALNDCSADGYCLDIGLGNGSGICFDQCVTNADCRAGYSCQSLGPASVCFP